jgi:hypothetical protein
MSQRLQHRKAHGADSLDARDADGAARAIAARRTKIAVSMRRAYVSISVSVALVLIATCVYFGRGSYTTTPVASPQPQTVSVLVSPEAAELQTQRHAPDGLTALKPGDECPVSAYFRPQDPDFPPGPTLGGSGPLWLQGLESPLRAGAIESIQWIAHSDSGFFLVRARRLDESGAVLFSPYPPGKPFGNDLVLPRQVVSGNVRWVTWEGALMVSSPGCYGLSIRVVGTDAAEIIVVHAI